MGGLCDILDKITGCEVPSGVVASKDPKARYSKIRIRMNESYTDKEFHLSGSFICVAAFIGRGSLEIKLDYIGSQKIDLREVQQIKANFTTIYATSDGEGGNCDLYICQGMETAIIPGFATFSGSITSIAVNTENTVERIDGRAHNKVNTVKIRNTHATYGVDLGYVAADHLPGAAEFRNWGFRLIAQDVIEFEKVDLFMLGCISTVDDNHVSLSVIATQF